MSMFRTYQKLDILGIDKDKASREKLPTKNSCAFRHYDGSSLASPFSPTRRVEGGKL